MTVFFLSQRKNTLRRESTFQYSLAQSTFEADLRPTLRKMHLPVVHNVASLQVR
jgi:hypothetical protein